MDYQCSNSYKNLPPPLKSGSKGKETMLITTAFSTPRSRMLDKKAAAAKDIRKG
jgi:hypothetical protein